MFTASTGRMLDCRCIYCRRLLFRVSSTSNAVVEGSCPRYLSDSVAGRWGYHGHIRQEFAVRDGRVRPA